MLEVAANALVILVGFYALVGIVFGVFFVSRGVGSIDPSASEGTWGFRVLVFPGAVAFWLLLLRRYRARQPPPEEHNAHRDLARADDVATKEIVVREAAGGSE